MLQFDEQAHILNTDYRFQITDFRMNKKTILYISIAITLILRSEILNLKSIDAIENPQTPDDSLVSATIGINMPESPILITPCDNCVTRNRFEQFSWWRSDLNNVAYYQLILDHVIIADHILPHTSQDSAGYLTQVTAEKVFLNLKTALPEGAHVWLVRAVVEDAHADSETWHFTVDTTNPIIILQAVDKNVFYWATNDPASIPPADQRHLKVTTANPLLSGKVEAYAAFKLSLVCPPATSSCDHQTITIVDTDGNWEHRFYGLLPDVTYTAYLSATDAAGNSNYFPEFTITYTPGGLRFPPFIIPPGVIKPTLSPTPSPSPQPLPPTYIKELIPYRTAPPAPPVTEIPQPSAPLITDSHLTLIIVWGLLIHLLACLIGFQVSPFFIPTFFSALLFPYLRRHNGLTSRASFVRLMVYSASDKPQLLKRVYSQATATFRLDLSQHDLVLIKAFRAGFTPFSALFYTQPQQPFTYLLPLVRKDRQSLQDNFLGFVIWIRILPLLIAILTSSYALAIFKTLDLFLLSYLFISLYLLFIEYLYPRIKTSH
ncbi:hypothetical protein A2368_04115 [Candidatus Collierbacteria bacterium RIFOXYB1_FULL_49_13]|uniref:Uncharacterized protein n=1 Tax=Candidatus Collierbacteria bacterium RIFOXYB1_FULL_49_13 TaxID=1817728 RepID=A0A1F5FHY9_9BACT|nr:MAG: hypothetical protein A2368_04115 [Candidatus Collierbacteria bacterium RIFOXYB1_FULL_49_13]